MVATWISIVIMAYGVFHVFFFSILGFGITSGRTKWIYDRWGPLAARLFNFIIGSITIIVGVIWFID